MRERRPPRPSVDGPRLRRRCAAAPRTAPSARRQAAAAGPRPASRGGRRGRPSPRARGSPWPRRRKTRPAGVPGGTLIPTGPSSVGTWASPPSTAVVSGTRNVVCEVVALPLERGVGRDPHAQVEVARAAAGAAPALARHPHARALAHARRDLHLDALRSPRRRAPRASCRSAPRRASARPRPRRRPRPEESSSGRRSRPGSRATAGRPRLRPPTRLPKKVRKKSEKPPRPEVLVLDPHAATAGPPPAPAPGRGREGVPVRAELVVALALLRVATGPRRPR